MSDRNETKYEKITVNGIMSTGSNAVNVMNTFSNQDVDINELIREIREISNQKLADELQKNMNINIDQMQAELNKDPKKLGSWKEKIQIAASMAGIGNLIIKIFEKFNI